MGHFANGLCFQQTGCIRPVQNRPVAKGPKPKDHFATGLDGIWRVLDRTHLTGMTSRNITQILLGGRVNVSSYKLPYMLVLSAERVPYGNPRYAPLLFKLIPSWEAENKWPVKIILRYCTVRDSATPGNEMKFFTTPSS